MIFWLLKVCEESYYLFYKYIQQSGPKGVEMHLKLSSFKTIQIFVSKIKKGVKIRCISEWFVVTTISRSNCYTLITHWSLFGFKEVRKSLWKSEFFKGLKVHSRRETMWFCSRMDMAPNNKILSLENCNCWQWLCVFEKESTCIKCTHGMDRELGYSCFFVKKRSKCK